MQIVEDGKKTVYKCGKKYESKQKKNSVKTKDVKTQEVNNESEK